MPATTLPSYSGSDMKTALLVLEDGRHFVGESFGAEGETFGEAVFATAMTGYQETLTDPSYRGQVVIATAPHIGNTGWNDEDDESRQIWVAGYVVRDLSRISSNWRSRRDLGQIRTGLRLGQIHCAGPLACNEVWHIRLTLCFGPDRQQSLNHPIGQHRA